MLQAQQAPALPYDKVVGRPGTRSYPAPSPDPTTHHYRSVIPKQDDKNAKTQRQRARQDQTWNAS